MPRREIPSSDYDQGYFRLYSDGSIAVNFDTKFLCLRTEHGYAEISLKKEAPDFPDCPPTRDCSRPADGPDLFYHCRKAKATRQCPKITSQFIRAAASNTNTFVRVERCRGVSRLDTVRSRRHRWFVHHDETWIEANGADANSLWFDLVRSQLIEDEIRSRHPIFSCLRAIRDWVAVALKRKERENGTKKVTPL